MSSRLKRERKADIVHLNREYLEFNKAHKCNHTPTSLQALEAAKIQLNFILTTDTEKILCWSGWKCYHQSNKNGFKLKLKLSPKTSSLTLPKIKTTSRDLTQNLTRIMETFQAYYSKLYRDHKPLTSTEQDPFVRDLTLPKISDEHRNLMGSPFSMEEVLEVIKSLKLGSAPGPDSFSSGYYKKFGTTLAPYPTRLF